MAMARSVISCDEMRPDDQTLPQGFAPKCLALPPLTHIYYNNHTPSTRAFPSASHTQFLILIMPETWCPLGLAVLLLLVMLAG